MCQSVISFILSQTVIRECPLCFNMAVVAVGCVVSRTIVCFKMLSRSLLQIANIKLNFFLNKDISFNSFRLWSYAGRVRKGQGKGGHSDVVENRVLRNSS